MITLALLAVIIAPVVFLFWGLVVSEASTKANNCTTDCIYYPEAVRASLDRQADFADAVMMAFAVIYLVWFFFWVIRGVISHD